jgi:hypothetical protein
MDRVAELEHEVTHLRRRVAVTRHVAEDMSAHVSADRQMVDLVIDDVLVHWAEDSDRPVEEVWREYANRIEWDDAELGTMRADMCIAPRPDDGPFDMEMYFARCWMDHCEALSLSAILRAV